LTSFVLEFKPEKIYPMQLPKVVLSILIPVSLFVARSNALAQKTGSTLVTGKVIIDGYGAIIRGNLNKKEIALVLTGDEFADGGEVIRTILHKNKVQASFFFTGNFYANPSFKSLILGLKKDGHYMGAHSDRHLLYADWTKRDSLLVTKEAFKTDLQNNYQRMAEFGIKKKVVPYYLPPYEWYNSVIARWTRELGLHLVNFSPGTSSAADYTYPEMMERYMSSDEIYQSILKRESDDTHGLNGFILLIHIGTDPRRRDKFYNKLEMLVGALRSKGYCFVRIDRLIQ